MINKIKSLILEGLNDVTKVSYKNKAASQVR